MGFLNSLSQGNRGEWAAVNLMESFGVKAEINEDREKLLYYDIVCDFLNSSFTCEVKYDIMARRTGNIAIEYFNSKLNKPSGILATESDFWITVLDSCGGGYEIYICKTDDLKKFLENNNPDRNLADVGDDNACIMLYTKEKMMDLFQELSEENLKELLDV